MHVLINISEDVYTKISNSNPSYADDFSIYYAIKNGVPIPKGHGDLKDMGNLQYVFDLTREDSIYSGKDIERAIKSMKTIIEADRSEEK